jgi:hypothetical protein
VRCVEVEIRGVYYLKKHSHINSVVSWLPWPSRTSNRASDGSRGAV